MDGFADIISSTKNTILKLPEHPKALTITGVCVVAALILMFMICNLEKMKFGSAFGFGSNFDSEYAQHIDDHIHIKNALKSAGFGYSSKDSAAFVANSVLKSQQLEKHCKEGIDEVCYYPGHQTKKETEPANRHLWNPIRSFSGPYSIDLDELDQMEERISQAYAAAEERFDQQDRPNRHLDLPPPQGKYKYKPRRTYEEMRQGFGNANSAEGSGQGRDVLGM